MGPMGPMMTRAWHTIHRAVVGEARPDDSASGIGPWSRAASSERDAVFGKGMDRPLPGPARREALATLERAMDAVQADDLDGVSSHLDTLHSIFMKS